MSDELDRERLVRDDGYFRGVVVSQLETIARQQIEQNGSIASKADRDDLVTEVKERRVQGKMLLGLILLILAPIIALAVSALK